MLGMTPTPTLTLRRYREELMEQMAVQEERKVLEPFLMTKAERQMNAALLRSLPQ